MESKNKILLNAFVLAFILGIIMLVVPQIIGLGREGFNKEELRDQFSYYIVTGISALVLIILALLVQIFIKKDDKYGDSIVFASPGEKPALSFFKKYSNFRLFLLSSIIFSILGLVNFLSRQQVFTGVSVLKEQFTNLDNIIFSNTLVPISENLGAALIIAAGIFGLRYILYKRQANLINFNILIYLVPFLIGIYAVALHLLRYSGSEVSLIVVFFFWTIGGFLTLMTGSFIPFLTMHLMNNLFYDLKAYFNRDIVWVVVTIAIILLIASYFLLYMKGKKKQESNFNINNIYK